MTATLHRIYLGALEACAPDVLVRRCVTADMPRSVVAIGKCAGALRDGLADDVDAFVAIPRGYRRPAKRAEVVEGGHPDITRESFDAGVRLLEWLDGKDDVVFLVSGGGSACIEQPLRPWFDERDLIDVNARLVASGLPIAAMNCVRKHLSAIKGGRLAARVERSTTLIYSDVAGGALADVASGPTLPDATTKADTIAILETLGGCDRIVSRLRDERCPDTVTQIASSRVALIADNATLVRAAAEIAAANDLRPVVVEEQVESDVGEAARELLERATALRRREVLIAGGEPTVVRRGDGKGGRCIELAVRMAVTCKAPIDTLFGSSDGVDGNSGAAGVMVSLPADPGADAARELAGSNSMAVAERIGKPFTLAASGNNLRDLYLLARR